MKARAVRIMLVAIALWSTANPPTVAEGGQGPPLFQEDFSGDLSAWNLHHAATPHFIGIVNDDGNPPPALLLDDQLNYGCYATSKQAFSYVGSEMEFAADIKVGNAAFADQRFASVWISKATDTRDAFAELIILGASHPNPNQAMCRFAYDSGGGEVWESSPLIPIPSGNGDGWHRAAIRVRTDGRLECHLDGEWIYSGVNPLTPVYDGVAAVMVGGRRSLYDNVTVTQLMTEPTPMGFVFRAPGGNVNGYGIDSTHFEVTVTPGEPLSGTIMVEATNLWGANAVAPLGGTVDWGDRASQAWTTDGWIPTGTNKFAVALPSGLTAPAQDGDYHIIVAFQAQYTIEQVMSMTSWTTPGNPTWNDGNDAGFDWTPTQFDDATHNGGVASQLLWPDGFHPEWLPATVVTVHVRSYDGYVFRAPGGTLNGVPIDRTHREITVGPGEAITGTIVVEATNLWGANAVAPLGGTVDWGDRASQAWTTHGWIPTGMHTYSVPVNKTAPNDSGDYHIIVAFGAEYTIDQVMSRTNWSTPGNPIWNDGNDVGFDWQALHISQSEERGAAVCSTRFPGDWYFSSWLPATTVTVHVREPLDGFCWEQRATPLEEGYPALAFHDGKLWTFGGTLYNGPSAFDNIHSDAIYSYDPASNVWERKQARLPYAMSPYAAADLLVNGPIAYLSPQIGPGENNGWGTHNRLIEYDFANDVASETATYCEYPTIWVPVIAKGLDGTEYSLGGWNGGSVGRIYRNDGNACLTLLPETLGPGASPMAGCHDALGRYVIFGHRWALNRVQIFDPQTESIVFTGDILPHDLEWTNVCWLDQDGSIYVANGYADGTSNARVYKFDSESHAFTLAPFELPTAEYFSSRAYDSESGKLYLMHSTELPGGTFETSLWIGTPGDCAQPDCDGNGVPDDQQPDCDNDGTPDVCELPPFGTSSDCNTNGLPDECELAGNDCDANGVPDECQPDCDDDGTPDVCELAPIGTSPDCNQNNIPDECDLTSEFSLDCNEDGVPDECDAPAASRDLSEPREFYCDEWVKTVRVAIEPPPGALAISVEDAPPVGWNAIVSISDGGWYDAVNHKVKWGPFFAPFPTFVSYDIQPPSGSTAEVCFGPGVASVDGYNETVCGDTCIEHSCCPFAPADDVRESCDGCADCGDECRDGRVIMNEMVGYACAWKRGCNDDIGGMTRSAYIWRAGECYCWSDDAQNWMAHACTSPASGCCDGGVAASVEAPQVADVSMDVEPLDRAGASRRPALTKPPHDGIGTARRVVISAIPPDGTQALAAEVEVPKGWTVQTIGQGGAWDDAHRKVKWGPFFGDASMVLTFEAKPARETAANGKFRGTVSCDGTSTEFSGR